MRLFLDGELVGEAVIAGSIPPVQNLGVVIGNGVDQAGRQFPGQIDEVKIWRLDPKAMKREFLGRPYTKKAARCWERNFAKVFNWIKDHPEPSRALAQQIREWEYGFSRSLLLLPDSDQARLQAILVELADLWFAGKIAGPEMAKVWCDWIAQLRALGLDPGGGPGGTAIATAVAKLQIETPDIRRCDPQIAGFLKLLRSAVEKCGLTKEV